MVRHDLGYYNAIGMAARYHPPTFSPQLTLPALYNALKSLLSRHAPFSVCIAGQSTPNPCFVRPSAIDLRELVTVVQLSEATDREQQLKELIQENSSVRFENLDRIPPWRIIVVRPPLSLPETEHGVDIALFVHHSIVDGGGALIFQQHLLAILNSEELAEDHDPIFKTPDLTFLPPIEVLLPMPVRWLTLAKALFGAWFPRSNSLWTGPPASVTEPIRTRLSYISLPASEVSLLLKACKANKTTMTALLQACVSQALFQVLPTDGSAEELIGSYPINLRRFIQGIDAETMGVFVASGDITFTRTEVAQTTVWDAARRIKLALDAKLAKRNLDLDTGMIRYVRNVRTFITSMVGKRRRASFEISNVGVADGLADCASGGPGWKMSRVVFTQSAIAVGAAILFNVCTVRGRDMCIAATWQEGVLDDRLACDVITEVSGILRGLL